MKKAVKFLPATAAVVAVTSLMTTTNNVVDAFSIHPPTHHRQSTATATTKCSQRMMTATPTMNGHGLFCTCYGCTSTGGSIKLLSSDRHHPSGCDCTACSSSTSVGASEQKPILKKSRFGITHGSLCDCGFCRQKQRHHHGPGCSNSQCM